jgi:enamine deaminase RidA (YjgF/YER057c/UK114 family)
MRLLVILVAAAAHVTWPLAAAEPKYIFGSDGTTAAVIVEGRALAHSGQAFATDCDELFHGLPPKYRSNIVKLNVYAKDVGAADAARQSIKRQYPTNPPAAAFVVGQLADPKATLGMDMVYAVPPDGEYSHTLRANGSRVYVSGQAEKGATPAEAARNTLASLKKTLAWLGCTPADVVQAKAFLKPITAANNVRTEFAALFEKGKAPPLIFVEWESSLPVEIELIANAPTPKDANPPPVEFLTPPRMTASPVYCRVARVNAPETIYINGLYSAKTERAGPGEVPDVFALLRDVLKKSDSDFRHLVKATYYVSANDVSTALNELRPKFYDPKRPPAASKAMVAGVGMKDRSFTMDMIAVRNR